jgi:tRNA(Arg) A34 adenosine deaminase TadA
MVALENDPTLHTEMVAIKNACRFLDSFSLEGFTLYTSCEPCPMCLSACYWARTRGRLWASPHYEPSVCAPYTTDIRADFDFTTSSPKEAVCFV